MFALSVYVRYFKEFIADATVSLTESGKPVFDLKKFGDAISKYRKVQSDVDEMVTPSDIGWLRVDSMPIKQKLGTWATKWTYVSLTTHVFSVPDRRIMNAWMACTSCCVGGVAESRSEVVCARGTSAVQSSVSDLLSELF